MRLNSRVLILLAALFPSVALAEIEKVAIPTNHGISFYWWPKLVPPNGWFHDSESSYANGCNILVPKGGTFADAETVMYAKASYKPSVPEIKSLADFIKHDKDDFASRDVQIIAAQPFHMTNGKEVVTYDFLPKAKGNWERVGYVEEGDYYLTFAISSRSRNGLNANQDAYKYLIENYK